jgi:large subunit ribosomal protein L6
VTVEGPKGKLDRTFPDVVKIAHDAEGNQIVVSTEREDRQTKAFHGLTRALLQNMVIGVTNGYEKRLHIVGVGYLAAVQGNTLQLRVGYANEVKKPVPPGLTVTCPDQTHVVVQGCDKQLVGQFAAEVRAVRKPEPYKGKGVRYEGEHVKIKPGKAAS